MRSKLLLLLLVVLSSNLAACSVKAVKTDPSTSTSKHQDTKSSTANLDTALNKCIGILKFGKLISYYKPKQSDAVIALGLMGDERAVDVLTEFLMNHENRHLRTEIVRALAEIKSKKAIPALRHALNDDYIYVRKLAQYALNRINENDSSSSKSSDRDPVEKCIKILKFGIINRYDVPCKTDAAIALGLIGDERAIDVLVDFLANHENDNLRMEIAKALGRIGSKQAVPALKKALSDNYSHVRAIAKLALAEIAREEY